MAYNSLKIHGGCDINYVLCENSTLSETEIQALFSNGLATPDWGSNTFLLASFNKNTNGDPSYLRENVLRYKIQRYEVGYDKLYNVATTERLSLSDHNIRNGKSYQYRVTPVYANEDGAENYGIVSTSEVATTDWQGWSIVGLLPTESESEYIVDSNNIWLFELNLTPEPIKPIFNKNYLTGFGQFPKVVQGEENYLEGSVSGLLGHLSCSDEYVLDDIDMIEKWRAFCNDGNLKLLKDTKGHVIPCSIKDTTPTIDYALLEKPTTISFSFVQLMNREDISAYGLEG